MENNANVFNNEVSFQNFHLNTIANFQEITEADLPNRPPDFISDSGSKYWHEGDVVIRQANHWGAENMSGCNWMLNYSSSKVLSQGKCKLNHFRNKNIVKILDSETNNRNFTNNTTKDDIRHIISGTYKVSYGANIQATTRYIRESTGAILETTGSRVSKEKEETYLKKYITDNNLWYLTPLPKPFGRGFEQTVYLIDEKYVIKTNNGIAFDSWLDYLNNLLLHNYFFPQTAYELLGFTENNGKLLSVVKQLFIEATEETDLNFLKYYLLRRGFEYIRNNNYQNFELGIIVKDLHGENVLTENGILQFIDTDFYLEKNYSDKFNDGGVIQSKPSYLMTLQEYQQTVTPILQEYNKFIKKNQQYFTKADFNGIFYYTFPELLADVKKGKQKGFKFRKGEYDKGLTDDEFARKSFSYRTVGRFDKEYEPEPIPNALTEKKNEYIDKLKQFFTEEEIVRLIETDETKSNKRSVKRAIDNNTYKTLLEEGKVTLEQIEKVATSVEVKLPKKVLDEGTLRTQENKAIYDKIYSLMPSVNRQVLSKMVDDIKETFKPLEKIIYDKETKRYEELILETYKQNEADVDELNRWLEFYKEIFTFEKQEKRTKLINDKPFKTDWLVGLSLKNDWQQTVIKYVLAYIERLKANMIYSIIDNFKKITQPIENIEQIALKVGIKGFEGEYKFNFKNGSSFIFKTEAIGAGGYNIQTYHFRYLTHFTDIILADGTKASNKISIVEHFSDKQISEQIFNPYFAVKNSENIEQIIEALYNYLKSNSFYNNIRKSISKDGGSLSYKEWQGRLAGNYFYIKRSDSLDENKNKAYNLLEKLKVKKPDGFDSNNSEVKKLTLGGFIGSVNNDNVDAFIDNQGRKRFYIDDWTAQIREDIVYETIENVNKSNTPQEYKLSQIMYLWDAYKYYPSLANIGIVFYKDEFDEKNAYYDLRTGKININCIKLTKDYDRYIDYTRKHESAFTERGNNGKFKKRILGRPEYIIRLLRRKLLHESQHILQRFEGIQPISTALNDVVHYVRKKYNVEHLSASDFNSFISEKHNTTYQIAIYKEYRLIPTEQECFDVEEALQQKYNELDEEEVNKFADGGELKTIQYGDPVTFNKDSDKTTQSGRELLYKIGQTGHIINVIERDGKTFYTIMRGMTAIQDVPESDIDLHKKDVREKVEEILTEKQQKKEFKDIGKRVSGSQKEKIALGNIINLSDLKSIEEDEITAIKTVVKERVYPEINVEEQKALGVTSGAAYIKIETRKACGNTPPNDKNKRASYVKFINKFTQDTYNIKTVKEIQDIYYAYEKWTPNEIIGYLIDPSFLESSDEVKQKLEKFFNEKFRFGRSYAVKQLVTEIFGKRFANFMFGGSDAARKTWHEAKSFEPVSKEESDSLIAKDTERKHKFIDANKQKVEHFTNATIEVLKSELFNFSFGDYHKKLFKQDIEAFRKWAIDYYQKRVDDGIKSLEVTPPHIQQRENNWEWYEKSPEKRIIKKSQEIQINSGKPLAFIKRVGGVKIAEEYVDKTKETDLSKNPITNDFGFKTVQFGQSLQDKSAKEHIRHFLGAMSDMSELLGIDIKSLNKIGNLSIAFASRGKRGALAHFEAGRKIINITDKRGDGTINHEYFHYIDNALTTIGKEGISLTFGSDEPDKILNSNVATKIKAIMDFIYKGKAGITEPVKVLFKKEARSYSVAPKFYSHRTGTKAVTMLNTIDETIELLRVEYPDIVSVNTKYTDYQKTVFGYIINHFGLNEYEVPLSMTTSNFFYGSEKMSSAYWIRPWELFARASETYMYDKLVKNNRFNNYLVNDDMFYEVMLNNGSFTSVYPYGKEREYLYELYDNFIDTIKTEYNLASFVPISNKREDEYLVLEENQEVDENVDAGIVVDVKTDKVEEIIHDNKEVVAELNNSDYESAMDLANTMVELTEGKEKQDWLDYIDILNIMKVK